MFDELDAEKEFANSNGPKPWKLMTHLSSHHKVKDDHSSR
jgi:hypothetical protein